MIDDPWANDKLNRRADGEHLISVLLERYAARKATGTGSYILNIDAAWGEGKTFFLDCLKRDLEQRGHVVASVNAWKDDHADEPLITVMAALDEALDPFVEKGSKAATALLSAKKALGIVATETAKQVGFHVLKTVTGIAAEKTLERLKEAGAFQGVGIDEKAFDKSAEHVWDESLKQFVGERVSEHRKANEGIETFRLKVADSIAAASETHGKARPMFIFVDELDRCRPLYALRLLEDMKHLFDIDGLVFVVATDSDQLSHSVKAVYGAEFAARKYLRRFFDRVFVFPEADRADFIKNAFDNVAISLETSFFDTGGVKALAHLIAWADGLKMSNRDIVQVVEIVQTFVTSFEHNTKIEPTYLLGLITAFYRADEQLFDRVAATSGGVAGRLDNWRVPHLRMDQRSRRYETVFEAADSVMTSWGGRLKSPLHTLTEQEHGSLYNGYFSYEFATLHNSSYMSDAPPLTILNEYPSRVRNAGRVIDRDRAPAAK